MNKLYVTNENLLSAAQALAAFTHQILICTSKPSDEIFLQLDANGLAIITQQFKPLYVAEIYSRLYLRRKNLQDELLIKAIKIKADTNIFIIDATAGLAKDSILLGLYGYRVLMLEQNPLLATVIHYAMQEKLIPADNLQLVFINSITYFKNNPGITPYAIYLDLMFNKHSAALAKKEMQVIQLLTKDTPNLDTELFHAAYTHCQKLIIKRDNKQPALVTNPSASYTKSGKIIRYDVYLRTLLQMPSVC